MAKAKSKSVSQPVVVKGYTFAEVLAEQNRKMKEEENKFNAMSESEKEAYIKQCEEKQKEIDKLVQELNKFPGFTQIRF